MPFLEAAVKRMQPIFLVAAATLAVVGARAGHEFPIYPSYYPHAITLRTIDRASAAQLLRTMTRAAAP